MSLIKLQTSWYNPQYEMRQLYLFRRHCQCGAINFITGKHAVPGCDTSKVIIRSVQPLLRIVATEYKFLSRNFFVEFLIAFHCFISSAFMIIVFLRMILAHELVTYSQPMFHERGMTSFDGGNEIIKNR